MRIISTIEEIQEYLPVNVTSEITIVSPFINAAERSFIISIIGIEQFKELVEVYRNAGKHIESVHDEETKEAIRICQKIAALLGYYKALPILSVKIGDSGIQVYSNQDTKQAFAWQVENVNESLLDLGYSAIEELLLHLENNPDKFPKFIDSPEFVSTEQFLIENAKDFSRHFNINNSRYAFSSIAYIMARIESQVVEKMFGKEFISAMRLDDIDGKSVELANSYLKPGIALLTAAKAIVERVITLENGVARINLASSFEAAKNTITANRDQVKDASEQLTTDGNQFLADGLQFLLDNRTDFPDYQEPVSKKRYNVKNDPNGGVFAI